MATRALGTCMGTSGKYIAIWPRATAGPSAALRALAMASHFFYMATVLPLKNSETKKFHYTCTHMVFQNPARWLTWVLELACSASYL